MRSNTIKLIHVARRSLGLDDETYRAMLATVVPGKNSCSDMSRQELKKVVNALKDKGFTVKPAKKPRRMTAPSEVRLKIRIIWRVMFNDGFVRDGSDSGLDRFVKRHTSKINGGQGVASLEWLRGDMEANFLESLKQWHIRAMKKSLNEHGMSLPKNPRSGEAYRDYDTICRTYAEVAKRWKK